MIEEDDDFRLGGKSSVTSDAHLEYEKDIIEQLNNITAAVRTGRPVSLPTGPTQIQPFQFEPDPELDTKDSEPLDAPIAYFKVHYIWPSVNGSMQPTLSKNVFCTELDEVEDKFFEIIVKSIDDSNLSKNAVTTDDLEIEYIEAVRIDSTSDVVYDKDDDEPDCPEDCDDDHEHQSHVHWAPTTPNVTRPTLTAQMRHHGVTMATSPISPSQGVYQQLGTTWSSTPPGKEDKSDEIESLSEAYKRLVESGTVTGQEILKSVQEQVREQVEAQLIDGPGETKMFVGKEVKGMLEPDPVEEVPVKEAKDNKSRILNFFRNERLNSTMTAFEAEQKLGYHYPI
ncbi:hypothetical protein SEA_NIAGARA_1 [Gordonia phage Niagara]|nr:hypothetical protein SEA_NIAGARA_1 [Gordonia phage Niagara]